MKLKQIIWYCYYHSLPVLAISIVVGAAYLFGSALENLSERDRQYEKQNNAALFGAWSKQTGNVKQLTLEEFVALKRSGLIKLNSE